MLRICSMAGAPRARGSRVGMARRMASHRRAPHARGGAGVTQLLRYVIFTRLYSHARGCTGVSLMRLTTRASKRYDREACFGEAPAGLKHVFLCLLACRRAFLQLCICP